MSEQDKVRKCLSSIGHEDDLCLVEESVLIEGYLDKKGPHALGGTKKFVFTCCTETGIIEISY